MPKQAPSGRSSGHITLSCGLLSIPSTLYTGTVSAHGIERHEYLPVPKLDEAGDPVTVTVVRDDFAEQVPVYEDHPVGRGPIDKETGELIPVEERARIQRKIETEYGPVFVADHEIESLFTLEPDTLKIKEFQPQHLFAQGAYVPKALMYLEPAKAGTGSKKAHIAAAVKLLGTLFKGMREEGVIALGELTTRGVPKPVVITPDGKVWLVWHTDALREQRDLPEVTLVEAEVSMLRSLIATMKSDEVADLDDERSALIQGFADAKARAGDFGQPDPDTYVAAAPAEPAVDLMAMLAASVEAAKSQKSA